MRIRKGSRAELQRRIEDMAAHQGAIEAVSNRVELLGKNIRAASITLEAERAELLARVNKIDATLELLGRTRSHGGSPEW